MAVAFLLLLYLDSFSVFRFYLSCKSLKIIIAVCLSSDACSSSAVAIKTRTPECSFHCGVFDFVNFIMNYG